MSVGDGSGYDFVYSSLCEHENSILQEISLFEIYILKKAFNYLQLTYAF